jgi:hypothetical protein
MRRPVLSSWPALSGSATVRPAPLGRNIAVEYRFMAGGANRRQHNGEKIMQLEELRVLLQAVIDYNEPLRSKAGHQAAAGRRIAEATLQIQALEREIADLRD